MLLRKYICLVSPLYAVQIEKITKTKIVQEHARRAYIQTQFKCFVVAACTNIYFLIICT